MPIDPRSLRPRGRSEARDGTGSTSRRFLQRHVTGSWRFAHEVSLDLLRQIEFLPWSARAEALDTFFLRQAEALLRPKGLTQLVAGDEDLLIDTDGRATRFASWSRATLTAVLLELQEPARVGCGRQALTFCLGRDPGFARAAALWIRRCGREPVETALRDLPGYCLVLMASSRSDTASRFLARDSFWSAVMNAR